MSKRAAEAGDANPAVSKRPAEGDSSIDIEALVKRFREEDGARGSNVTEGPDVFSTGKAVFLTNARIFSFQHRTIHNLLAKVSSANALMITKIFDDWPFIESNIVNVVVDEGIFCNLCALVVPTLSCDALRVLAHEDILLKYLELESNPGYEVTDRGGSFKWHNELCSVELENTPPLPHLETFRMRNDEYLDVRQKFHHTCAGSGFHAYILRSPKIRHVDFTVQLQMPYDFFTGVALGPIFDIMMEGRCPTLVSVTLRMAYIMCAVHNLTPLFTSREHTLDAFDFRVLDRPGDTWKYLDHFPGTVVFTDEGLMPKVRAFFAQFPREVDCAVYDEDYKHFFILPGNYARARRMPSTYHVVKRTYAPYLLQVSPQLPLPVRNLISDFALAAERRESVEYQ